MKHSEEMKIASAAKRHQRRGGGNGSAVVHRQGKENQHRVAKAPVLSNKVENEVYMIPHFTMIALSHEKATLNLDDIREYGTIFERWVKKCK